MRLPLVAFLFIAFSLRADSQATTADVNPTTSQLWNIQYYYNWNVGVHAFCADSTCLQSIRSNGIGYDMVHGKGLLGKAVSESAIAAVQTACPTGSKNLRNLGFVKSGRHYNYNLTGAGLKQGWVSTVKGACGATVPIKAWRSRLSDDLMYGVNLEWDSWYKGMVQDGGNVLFYLWKSYMRYIMKCMLTGAQNEESTADERQEALEALLDWYIDNYRDDEFELAARNGISEAIVNMSAGLISTRSHATNPLSFAIAKVGRVLTDCIMNMENSPAVHALIDDDCFLPWIIDRILSTDNGEHEEFAELLFTIMRYVGAPGRTTIIVRHSNLLGKAVAEILCRDIDYDFFSPEKRLSSPEMTGFVATLGYQLHKRVLSWLPNDAAPTDWSLANADSVCGFVVEVMGSALASTRLLEGLLGFDLLRVAGLLAFHPSARDSQAEIFRTILSRYPKFNETFRKRTCEGDEGNPIANLGRSIPPKGQSVAAFYVFEEED